MALELKSSPRINAGSSSDILLRYSPDHPANNASTSQPAADARHWLLWDIRQEAGWLQTGQPEQPDSLTLRTHARKSHATAVHNLRTLDLYPQVPEFLGAAEIQVPAEDRSDPIEIEIKNWLAPNRPIEAFHLWLVSDLHGAWDLAPTGYKSYRAFVNRHTGERVPHDDLASHLSSVPLSIEGDYPPVTAARLRRSPGVFWGDLHGMAFNQRPLDDFYDYARTKTCLDFCAAMRFSYNTCVGDEWHHVKDAAIRHTVPGKFVAFAGFECGTPDNDSHRCVYFPDAEDVPPVFCDSRPPALDPMLQDRFHPDTVMCRTTGELYSTVNRLGGFVGGHFHTTTYDREILAEIWQKQDVNARSGNEEERLYELMRHGHRFGLTGGSDTHDSMPGNPDPEPGCPHSSGLTGVWADTLTAESLTEAFLARRVFAVTGARILMKFLANGQPMGSELPVDAPREFRLEIDGTAELCSVELLRNGRTWLRWQPGSNSFQAEAEDRETTAPAFYLVRVTQTDGHKGWTTPTWFAPPPSQMPQPCHRSFKQVG